MVNFFGNQQVNSPRPEGYHESEPREEENATMDTDHIEQRHRASLVVDGVELWCSPEQGRVEANHPYWLVPWRWVEWVLEQ